MALSQWVLAAFQDFALVGDPLYHLHFRVALPVELAVVNRCFLPKAEFRHSKLDEVDRVDMVLNRLIIVVRPSQKVSELEICEVGIAIEIAPNKGQFLL